MMRKVILIMLIGWAIIVSSCVSKKADYNPETCLSKEKQLDMLDVMVRYASKLAPEATHETKFSPEFDWYYERAVAESRILCCFLNEQDSIYQLLVARKARSITPMEEGIAVRIKFDQKGGFAVYEEVFRMWKMPADTLRTRGKFLFDRMVKGEDLTLYYSKFQRDRFIEFPNDRFTFDVAMRKWRDAELDSLKFE